jgi:hypothetical protein
MQFTAKARKSPSWSVFHLSRQYKFSLLVSLVIIASSIGFFVWCTSVSDDRGGDSFVGLVFALASTIFMLLAAVAFSLRRRRRKRSLGELNGVLNWHVCFGMIALVMVFLHAGGNFNPRTGTYALFGMIALVISGIVGRVLDRLIPRLIAQEAHKAQTGQGEDRIESISRKLQAIAVKKSPDLSHPQTSQSSVSNWHLLGGAKASEEQAVFQTWDLAYVSLEESPQELRRYSNRTTTNERSIPAYSSVLSPNTEEQISVLEEIERTHERERFFRYILRYWRIFHIALAMLTVGLTLWHIEYALALIMPAMSKFGFSYLLPWP